jgi:hypothetical protein
VALPLVHKRFLYTLTEIQLRVLPHAFEGPDFDIVFLTSYVLNQRWAELAAPMEFEPVAYRRFVIDKSSMAFDSF